MMTTKAVRVLAGGILLFLGLFTMPLVTDIASAADQNKESQDKKIQNKGSDGKDGKGIGKASEGLPCEIPPGQAAAHAEQEAKQASRLVTGELIRMDGNNYVVKDESGKEVSFEMTERTEVTPVNKGDRISVAVDNRSKALWIRANRGTDSRTEHASADCNPN